MRKEDRAKRGKERRRRAREKGRAGEEERREQEEEKGIGEDREQAGPRIQRFMVRTIVLEEVGASEEGNVEAGNGCYEIAGGPQREQVRHRPLT